MPPETKALAANDRTEEETQQSASVDPESVEGLKQRIVGLEVELKAHLDRREKEQNLLAKRNACLHAIEGAKARLGAEKKGLAEIEEQIAALLASSPTPWSDTPIGRSLKEEETPEWNKILPPVDPGSVRVLGEASGFELPTIDLICQSIITDQEMQGEKRTITKTVGCYGTPWIVTAIWKQEQTGALRANVVPLHTKEEWQQIYEEKYGRHVEDFDQSDEAKDQRQRGGKWCGLVVKVGRKVFVVGPQTGAMHLVHDPKEPNKEPEQEKEDPETQD